MTKDKAKLDKAAVRKHDAREEARSILLAGFGSLLQDDSMKSSHPDAVAMAGYMLDYIGNRRYEDEAEREFAEELLIEKNSHLFDPENV